MLAEYAPYYWPDLLTEHFYSFLMRCLRLPSIIPALTTGITVTILADRNKAIRFGSLVAIISLLVSEFLAREQINELFSVGIRVSDIEVLFLLVNIFGGIIAGFVLGTVAFYIRRYFQKKPLLKFPFEFHRLDILSLTILVAFTIIYVLFIYAIPSRVVILIRDFEKMTFVWDSKVSIPEKKEYNFLLTPCFIIVAKSFSATSSNEILVKSETKDRNKMGSNDVVKTDMTIHLLKSSDRKQFTKHVVKGDISNIKKLLSRKPDYKSSGDFKSIKFTSESKKDKIMLNSSKIEKDKYCEIYFSLPLGKQIILERKRPKKRSSESEFDLSVNIRGDNFHSFATFCSEDVRVFLTASLSEGLIKQQNIKVSINDGQNTYSIKEISLLETFACLDTPSSPNITMTTYEARFNQLNLNGCKNFEIHNLYSGVSYINNLKMSGPSGEIVFGELKQHLTVTDLIESKGNLLMNKDRDGNVRIEGNSRAILINGVDVSKSVWNRIGGAYQNILIAIFGYLFGVLSPRLKKLLLK